MGEALRGDGVPQGPAADGRLPAAEGTGIILEDHMRLGLICGVRTDLTSPSFHRYFSVFDKVFFLHLHSERWLRLKWLSSTKKGWAEHLEAKNRFLHPIRRSWRYKQPDHAKSALTSEDPDDVGGRQYAVQVDSKKTFKNARLLRPVDGSETEWQHDEQAGFCSLYCWEAYLLVTFEKQALI